MIVKNSLKEVSSKNSSIVTIGTFDGVHLGHQKIIKQLVASSKKNNLISTVLTFFPHPRMVLQQNSDLKLLNTLHEKTAILKSCGLEQLIIEPFTKEFSRLTALEFVRDVLVNKLHTKKIIIGYDHRFGRNRTASIGDLKEFGQVFNFEVQEISAKEINDVSVSSTKIRNALSEGDIKKANTYLGYSYMLTGTIIKGKGLGKQLHFPTANLQIKEPYKLIPKNGAYIVKSTLNNKATFGMMNIGYNPTVNGKKKSIEIHFFDFNNDLYNQKIQVHLIDRLRDEEKFSSVEALKTQLQKDKETALKTIKKYAP